VRTAAVVLVLVGACSRGDAAPAPAPAAATPIPTPTAPPALATFGSPCVADSDCPSHVCFHKRLKAPDSGRERREAEGEALDHDGYCSIHCNDDPDCPVPPTRGRCGARGMCKRPD
jgi:hypothetical protein